MFRWIGVNRFCKTAVNGQIGLFIAFDSKLIDADFSFDSMFSNTGHHPPVADLQRLNSANLHAQNSIFLAHGNK